MKKVVLAYSGGLDTSYCVKYLSGEMGLEVYTALANTGGFTPGELAGIEEKAYALGAKKHVTLDVTGEYYEKCIKYMIYGNVLRNKTYPVSVSSERTFQALAIVRYAKEIGADGLAHGSTGAGNDQVRFDLCFSVFGAGLVQNGLFHQQRTLGNLGGRERNIEFMGVSSGRGLSFFFGEGGRRGVNLVV